MTRRILTPRELAALLPTPERPLTAAELEQLIPSDVATRPVRPDGWSPWTSQESDRVPAWPPRAPVGQPPLSDEEIDRLLDEPRPEPDEPPRPWPPTRPKKAS